MTSREQLIIVSLSAGIALAGFGLFTAIQNDRLYGAISFRSKTAIGLLSANFLRLTSSGLELDYPNASIKVKPIIFKTWFEPYVRNYNSSQEFRPNFSVIKNALTLIARQIDKPAVNARFKFANGRVTELQSGQKGQKLNLAASTVNIIRAIKNNQAAIALVVDTIEPEVTAESINDLGISSLIGRGESDFSGSPAARMHNIKIGSTVINGLILDPNQEFSFNQYLGIVDETTGYKPELVIKKDKILPEYGGGLCQVSTTLFRAAMAAGLPIIERHPHSLPVRYYNPQGFDAAIYPGVMDLRFKNDTRHSILIQSSVKGTRIVFEIYGTDDGRIISIQPPQQYDNQPNGALKTVLTRIVTSADGKQDKQSFYSIYKSPESFTIIRNPLE